MGVLEKIGFIVVLIVLATSNRKIDKVKYKNYKQGGWDRYMSYEDYVQFGKESEPYKPKYDHKFPFK